MHFRTKKLNYSWSPSSDSSSPCLPCSRRSLRPTTSWLASHCCCSYLRKRQENHTWFFPLVPLVAGLLTVKLIFYKTVSMTHAQIFLYLLKNLKRLLANAFAASGRLSRVEGKETLFSFPVMYIFFCDWKIKSTGATRILSQSHKKHEFFDS